MAYRQYGKDLQRRDGKFYPQYARSRLNQTLFNYSALSRRYKKNSLGT